MQMQINNFAKLGFNMNSPQFFGGGKNSGHYHVSITSVQSSALIERKDKCCDKMYLH